MNPFLILACVYAFWMAFGLLWHVHPLLPVVWLVAAFIARLAYMRRHA